MATYSLDTLLADALAHGEFTAPEFDYALATGLETGRGMLRNAAYRAAGREQFPDGYVTDDGLLKDGFSLELADSRCNAILDSLSAEIEARTAHAKTLKFAGWSDYSTGPIRYLEG